MTTNQLTFQRNAIAAAELEEQERANRERERIQMRELAQEKSLKEQQLSQQDRENIAKYGAIQYPSENEDLWGGHRAWFNNIRRGFEYLINPVLSILTGGKR